MQTQIYYKCFHTFLFQEQLEALSFMYIWESCAFFHNHNLRSTTNLRTSTFKISKYRGRCFQSTCSAWLP